MRGLTNEQLLALITGIFLFWALTYLGTVAFGPDFVAEGLGKSWYYAGGVGAILMFLSDIKREGRKYQIRNAIFYPFMVVIGPVGALSWASMICMGYIINQRRRR